MVSIDRRKRMKPNLFDSYAINQSIQNFISFYCSLICSSRQEITWVNACTCWETWRLWSAQLFSGQNLFVHTPHYLYSQVNCIQSSWMQLSRMCDCIRESGRWWWWETWIFAIPCCIRILWQDKKHRIWDVGCSLLRIWLKPNQTALKGFHQIASLRTHKQPCLWIRKSSDTALE